MLQQTGVITSMAGELGIDEGTAKTAAGALLPAIVAGMGRSATGGSSTPEPLGGLGGLAGAVLGGGGTGGFGGGLLDSVLGSKPTPVNQGNDILGNIFGSKEVSRSVAGEVASTTGIDETVLKKMLPILAMAVAGYMAKEAATQRSSTNTESGGSPLGGILGSIVSGMMRQG
jgi:hypothetical protein